VRCRTPLAGNPFKLRIDGDERFKAVIALWGLKWPEGA